MVGEPGNRHPGLDPRSMNIEGANSSRAVVLDAGRVRHDEYGGVA